MQEKNNNKAKADIISRATARLRKVIEKRGIIHEDLAPVLGLSRSQVTRLLLGTRRLSLKQIEAIAVYLKVDPLIFLYSKRKLTKSLEKVTGGNRMLAFAIPLLQPEEAHEWRDNMEAFRKDSNRVHFPVPAQYQHCYLFPMYDAAMFSEKFAAFSYDDILICDPDRKPVNGDYVIIKQKDSQESICRKFIENSNQISLHAINPRYPIIIPTKQEDIDYLGVVVRIITSPQR